MSQSSYRLDLVCLECPTPCCRHVKHLPYLGECSSRVFETFLLGAFPLFGLIDQANQGVPLFAMEWIVPGELDRCPAYDHHGLCTIYDDRPISCRNFPLINPEGTLHDFCPFAENFKEAKFIDSDFPPKAQDIDLHLKNILVQKGMDALAEVIHEAKPSNLPLLFNSVWALMLVLAGADVFEAIRGQRALLKGLRANGLEELTVLIPYTDYCITGEIQGILANLDYLRLRLEDEGLFEKLETLLKGISSQG
ncbi:MAG: YkgJ family cysteine cluster protein [Thermodesulfobacteria bacterium]|nr:YkgJ family cysteine cluster protein [Thermodesulfobacteriota bacterium]